MSRPDPRNGQVVRYEYLWRSEEHEGLSEGDKKRPCAVVVALPPKGDEPQRVMICAITHTEPKPPSVGVEIPPDAKKRAGLDDDRSWIIVSEVNKVEWQDDQRFSLTDKGNWLYGVLAQEVMVSVRDAIMQRIKKGEMDIVDREQIDERVERNEAP